LRFDEGRLSGFTQAPTHVILHATALARRSLRRC
jgi:hypothetical protein